MATSAISITGQVDVANVQFARQLVPAFIPIVLPFAILIVPLLDFCLAVFRRLLAGKSPFSADRKHLHHRLLDMGHTDVRAVVIFYAWTTVIAVGCLLFLFLSTVLALTFVAIGLVICTIVTLAPLSRRKAVEAAVQLASTDETDEAALSHFDPLDAASNSAALDTDVQDSPDEHAAAGRALEALTRKDPT
jgi:UDP-GlcNAc:undecaprenyl-phosphate GlcNAc-1-phosphate transferase